MIPRDPAARDTLAGSYVLGTLRGRARRRFETALARDESLRAAVAAWERRLNPLWEDAPPVAPPERVWQSVSIAIAPPSPSLDRAGLWRSLPFWRSLALGLAGAAAALLVALSLPRETPRAPVVAVLQDQRNEAVWAVRLARAESALVFETLRPAPLPAGRSLQLWVLPPGATAPLPGPLLPASGERRAPIEPRLAALLAAGGQVLVSVEPEGGAPAGTPTGPVLYSGALRGL